MKILVLPFTRKASAAPPAASPLLHFHILLYPQVHQTSPLFTPPMEQLSVDKKRNLPFLVRSVDSLLSFTHRKWSALNGAGPIRNRIWTAGERLQSILDTDETFLKAIPLDSRVDWKSLLNSCKPLVELEYPQINIPKSKDAIKTNELKQDVIGKDEVKLADGDLFPQDGGFNPQNLQSTFEKLVYFRLKYHRKQLKNCFYCLPISMMFGILPMPNIAMMYNIFRLYSHWRALQGALTLEKCIKLDREHEMKQDNKGSLILFQENRILTQSLQPYIEKGFKRHVFDSNEPNFLLDKEFSTTLIDAGIADSELNDALNRAEQHIQDQSWLSKFVRARNTADR